MAAPTLDKEVTDYDRLETPHTYNGDVSERYSNYPSLFNPDTDEEFSSDSSSDLEGMTHPQLLRISEVVKETPKSLSAALDILLPRIQPTSEVKGVSMEDQQGLGTILVGELSNQFSILHHQIDDPFLDSRQNRKLHRQISVSVCKIIEQLYGEFIYKAAVLNQSGRSFSSNMTQLRAQLMVEANKRLNIPAIRRRVLKGLRGPIVSGPVVQRYCTQTPRLPPIPKWHPITKKKASQHSDDLGDIGVDIASSTTESKESRLRFGFRWNSKAIRRRIAKLEMRLPAATITVVSSDEEFDDSLRDTSKTGLGLMGVSKMMVRDDKIEGRSSSKLRRVSSNPELWGDFLLCDIGVTTRHKRPRSVYAKESLLRLHRPPSVKEFLDPKDWDGDSRGRTRTALGDYTSHDLSQDLHNLSLPSGPNLPIGDDDLHPLLQAHVHGLSNKQAARLTKFEASLRKEEDVTPKDTPTPGPSSPLEHSIPSVATLDQLPYLNIEHASGSESSNPSLHVASKRELTPSSEGAQTMLSSGRFESPAGSGSYLGPGSGQLSDGGSQYLGTDEEVGGAMQWRGEPPHGEEVGRPSLVAVSDRESLTPSPPPPDKLWGEEYFPAGLGQAPASEDPAVGQPQAAVVTARYPGQGVVRTSDVRVSERTPLMQLRQKFFGPIYNELAKDWDSVTTENLETNLNEGKEITAVYQELMKTLSSNHLKFENEPTLEPSLEKRMNLSKILASHTLHHRRTQRVINHELHHSGPAPWNSEHMDRQAWEESNQYKGADLELLQNASGLHSTNMISHNYITWQNTWKSTINPDDYFKFSSKKESDYLRLVYHLYDSDGSDSEDEAERRDKRERLAALQAKLNMKEERKRQRYRAKSLYQSGMWNIQTVTMGGLGEDPEESSSEEEDRETLKKFNEKASNLETVQKNLQQIWARLHVPTVQQIDMAIKYSGDITQTQLHKVLNLWESICDVIERRESALSQLESFEKRASDPSRFFSKGTAGSASVRLNEAKERDRLHNALDGLDKRVSFYLRRLQKECGDVVTYKGRPYAEKMRLDRTELLYWLQQARRQAVVRPSIRNLTLDEIFVSDSQSDHYRNRYDIRT